MNRRQRRRLTRLVAGLGLQLALNSCGFDEVIARDGRVAAALGRPALRPADLENIRVEARCLSARLIGGSHVKDLQAL